MRHGARSFYPLLLGLCLLGCGTRTLEKQKHDEFVCALVTDDKTLDLVCEAKLALRVKRVLSGFVDEMGFTNGTDLVSSPVRVAAGESYRITIMKPPSGKLRFFDGGDCQTEVAVTLELAGREEVLAFGKLKFRCVRVD